MQWCQALQLLAESTLHTHPDHRSHASNRLTIYTRTLCYIDSMHRTSCFNYGGLSPEQEDIETAHSALIGDWSQAYRTTAGLAGLVYSPMAEASFGTSGIPWTAFTDMAHHLDLVGHSINWVNAGGYYANWHCCAIFIAHTRIFIYDPHFSSATSGWADPIQPRSLATDLRDISMVRHLIRWASPQNGRKIGIHPDRIYIYRNNDSLQQRNAARGLQLAAPPGLDSVPLSIQWLAKIAEAWQYDPRQWLECGVEDRHGNMTQHGAIPMPCQSIAAALLRATAMPAHFDAADWERIRL
jgi:hypothetical protein